MSGRYPARTHDEGYWFDAYKLTSRTYHALKWEEMQSPAQVRQRTVQEWMRVVNFGKVSVAELERVFGPLGQAPAAKAPNVEWWDCG